MIYLFNSENNFSVNDVSKTIIDSENDMNCNATEKPSTSYAVKRLFSDIEHESPMYGPSPKRIDIKQDPDVIGSHLSQETDPIPLAMISPKVEKVEVELDNYTEQIAQHHSVSDPYTICKKYEQYVIKKGLMLRAYSRSNMFSLEFNSSIYKDAIKRIDIIDGKGLFSNSVLEELHNLVGKRGFQRSSVDLSTTYSNVRKYIINKIFTCINDIITTTDVPLAPGMAISNMKYNCVLNHLFFEKLRDNCEKIIQDIRVAPNDSLLGVFQYHINFYYCSGVPGRRAKFFISSKNRDIFCSNLKELIIETIHNLPRSIIWEIENFDQCDIVKGLFLDVHGVLLSKSSVRDLIHLFDSTKNEIQNDNFSDNLHLVGNLLEKVGNLVRKSCIFYEGEVFLPDKSMTEMLSKYLLSDMYGISVGFHKRIELYSENVSRLKKSGLKKSRPKKSRLKKSSVTENVGRQLPKLDLSIPDAITVNSEIEITQEHNYCKILQQCLILKRLKSNRYHCLWYKKITRSIYEDAIKKISIDGKGLFKNKVLEEIDSAIKRNGISRSSINISQTYSNVRKYVLDKISPYINNIMAVEDIPITSGMSISEARSGCISNNAFFEKLRERCEKMADDIRVVPDSFFLTIIQTHIRFGLDWATDVRYRKSKLSQEIKKLIIDTISNLTQSIIFEIKNFKKSDIINGLFLDIYGVLISKSSVRNLRSFLDSQKNKFSNGNSKDNIVLFDNLLSSLGRMLKTSVIFHGGKFTLPNKYTIKVFSKLLLLDFFDIPLKFYENIDLYTENISNINELSKDISFKDFNVVIDDSANIEMQSLKNEELIPKSNYTWDPSFITFLNIYEFAMSMIDIDKREFESSFLDEIKSIPIVVANFNKESRINFNLSVTYGRVKNYILETFLPFLRSIEKDTKVKIEIYQGMSLNELEFTYISNEKFFTELRSFCNEIIAYIKNRGDSVLTDMLQSTVHLVAETESSKRICLNKYRGKFNKCMSELLINNISSIPERIISIIKSLPRSKLLGEYFSFFHNIYVDNESLLKAKLVFDYTKQKIMNDALLIELANKVSLDMSDNFYDEKGLGTSKNIDNIINSYFVYKKLSTFRYIRKLVREEFTALRNNLTDSIMIISHDKVEMADQKIRCEILGKLESNLITVSIRLYKKLCVNKCELKSKE